MHTLSWELQEKNSSELEERKIYLGASIPLQIDELVGANSAVLVDESHCLHQGANDHFDVVLNITRFSFQFSHDIRAFRNTINFIWKWDIVFSIDG